jgi:hypothetical protein
VLLLPALDLLVGILDHDDGCIDHRADGDGDAAQGHDVGVHPLEPHHNKRRQHAERQREDRDQRRSDMPEEQAADQCHDDELLDQLVGEVLDRAIDQLRAVINRHHLDAGRQAFLEIGELDLDRRDGFAGILARAQDHNAAGDLAFAVQLGDAAPHLRADLDRGDVTQTHGHTAGGGLERDRPEVVERLQIARGADHIFGLGHLQHRTA